MLSFHVPPKPALFSMMTISRIPASSSLMAIQMPLVRSASLDRSQATDAVGSYPRILPRWLPRLILSWLDVYWYCWGNCLVVLRCRLLRWGRMSIGRSFSVSCRGVVYWRLNQQLCLKCVHGLGKLACWQIAIAVIVYTAAGIPAFSTPCDVVKCKWHHGAGEASAWK